MAILNVQSNGNAPAGAKIGDTIRTAGGNYTIVPANTAGSSYNPSSGFWSVRGTDSNIFSSASQITNMNNQKYEENVNLANTISANSSAQQYEYNSKEAQKNRDWQEMMSNTAHQREVEDLIKAGLNPVLSATLGGSSTPSGATASGSSYTGQAAPVDTSLLSAIIGLYGTMLGNETSKDIAKINAETALQTSKINSAATMYSANVKDPLGQVLDDFYKNHSAKMIKGSNDVISWISKQIKDFF